MTSVRETILEHRDGPGILPSPAARRAVDNCHDVARALARATGMIFAVPGKPVTHLIDLVLDLAPAAELSVNEKSAVEAAVGAAAVGVRTCVIVKQCGLAFAMDSLANAAVHGTGGGMLVVSGDDCDAGSSTCIFDSRELARTARLPVVDLALAGDADQVIATALRASIVAHVPVILRVTGLLHAPCSTASGSPATDEPAIRPITSHARQAAADGVDRDVAHRLTKLGRHQWHRQVTTPRLRDVLSGPSMVSASCFGDCTDAVIVSGAASRYLPDGDYCRLRVQSVWPLPDEVADFARRHNRTLLVEEPAPVLETALRAAAGAGAIMGRLDGRLPPEGGLSAELVAAALAGDAPPQWTAIARKTAGPASSSPYAPLFEAIARLRRTGVFVAADVGSAVQLCYPPYDAATVALSLGSAIGVAGGAARAGRRSLAVLGDFAVTHSALEALLEGVARDLPMLVVVLANGSQAQTGGQGLPPADRIALVRACGVRTIEEWPVTQADAHARLTGLLSGPLPAAVFVTSGGPRTG